ncbi:ribose transport system substrate-binding protein [Rhodococcus rhodochrous J38]|uniref:sugar ABC transporter substrate-binding protein n=1 Tax=Rhodococcus rhodochrous TaxID=1829 RepID=UPI0011AAA429|nr:sugar ABC transporter substrate-binding protein [Rhodococcus rhodochrous]TWH63174.1 ribose transport system substrate-binding protein [Rhodococcus rhodochrous J38]
MRHSLPGRAAIAALAFSAVFGLTSCSSGGSGGGDVSDADVTAGIEYARAQLALYEADPEFTLEAEPFPMKDIAGKTIFAIPTNSENPYNVAVDEESKKVAESYGATWIEYTNQGQPAQWATGVEQAVNQKVDLIILSQGVDASLIKPALEKADAAGIPVLLTHTILRGEPVPADLEGLIDATTDAPLSEANRLTVDWMIDRTEGEGNALIITSNEVPPAKAEVAAMEDEIAQYCPKCTYKIVNVPVTEWATKIQSEVQSALSADPNINFILPIYDSMSLYAQSGIKAAGKTGQVEISSVNGTPAVLKIQQDDGIVTMNVGESIPWLAWATMDQAGRLLLGYDPVPNGAQETPLKLITAENIDETGTPPQPDKGYGTAYITGYEALWGPSEQS